MSTTISNSYTSNIHFVYTTFDIALKIYSPQTWHASGNQNEKRLIKNNSAKEELWFFFLNFFTIVALEHAFLVNATLNNVSKRNKLNP